MGNVVIEEKVTARDLKKASEECMQYIKIVVDIKNETMTIGGLWHADGENKLLELLR